ncbi:hypothetical protein BGW39_009966 [Mortierella sp. 14UC]|nr:hypothetical protein BGW39_009966 [Mortierella sp. 14UC]
MADNTPMAENNNNDTTSMTDSNAMFGDFFELDLLDPADSNSDLFSFLLNNDDLNTITNSPSSLSTDSLLDLSPLDGFNNLENLPLLDGFPSQEDIPAEEPVKAEAQDLRFLLAHNLQQQQQEQQAQQTSGTSAIDNSILIAQLTNPAVLTAPPPQNLATPVASPATPTMKAPEPTISSAAATAQIAILLDSSKSTAVATSTTAAVAPTPTKAPSPAPASVSSSKKRSSPEPSAAARKKAKSETPPALTPISVKEPTTLSNMTSTADTTLSAATLQFLLQQQMQTPLVPQLFTGKLSREEIEETLARLLESTKYLIEASKESEDKDEDADSGDESESAESSEPGQTHGLKTQPGIKTDDIPSSKDLKKMTSKERRQLRNKISARNFRVRRKEYISTLEGQVEQHKTEARHLREAVTYVQAENQRLKEELEASKRQLAAQATLTRAASTAAPQQLQLAQPTSASLSNESQSLLTSLLNSAMNPNAKHITLTVPRPQSPTIIKPNLNKDVPNSSSLKGKSWKDGNPVFIHTTLIPEIHLADNLQFGPKPLGSKEDNMSDRPWMCMETLSKKPSVLEKNPLLMSGVIYELMQTIASAGLNHAELTLNHQESTTLTVAHEEENKATAQDYESDRRLGEALEWKMQLDLLTESQVAQALAARRLDVDQVIDNELSQEDLMRMFAHLKGTSASAVSTPTTEDPNMMEWLYESMMAGLVELDLQSIQDRQTFLPFSEVQFA